MTNSKRITKTERFDQLLAIPAVAADADLVAFIEWEQKLLSRKSKSDGTPTKAQRENAAVKVAIVAAVAGADEGLRSAEVADLLGISVQKSTALLKQLVDAGDVSRETVGKVTTFTVASDESEVDAE